MVMARVHQGKIQDVVLGVQSHFFPFFNFFISPLFFGVVFFCWGFFVVVLVWFCFGFCFFFCL